MQQVGNALATFERMQDVLKDQYNDLHGYLSKMKLLKGRVDRLDKDDPISEQIREKNSTFASNLQVHLTAINRLTGNNSLLAAKILLSYHRRLERYHRFFVEGRVKLSDATLNTLPMAKKLTT